MIGFYHKIELSTICEGVCKNEAIDFGQKAEKVDALNMVLILQKIMEHIGINPERLRIEWVSAGEGVRFANVMNEDPYFRRI